jgi:hypothetical protein
MLNLRDTTSTFRNVAMFIRWLWNNISQYVGMFVIYIHTKHHVPSFNGSLVIGNKIKDKFFGHGHYIVFVHVAETVFQQELHIFWRTYYRGPPCFKDLNYVALVQKFASPPFYYHGLWKSNVRHWDDFRWHNIHSKFCKNWPLAPKL